tara:strand:+ start:8668 stop:8823 length:156 start_codon:yes stop_codon:yes gene_type:complete
MITGMVSANVQNTTVSNGKVAPLKKEFALPHFIEGEVLTKRSNAETTRQMA